MTDSVRPYFRSIRIGDWKSSQLAPKAMQTFLKKIVIYIGILTMSRGMTETEQLVWLFNASVFKEADST